MAAMLGISIPVLIIIIIIIIIIIRILSIIGQARRRCPRAIRLAMIPREKQLTGFYEYRTSLGGPLK